MGFRGGKPRRTRALSNWKQIKSFPLVDFFMEPLPSLRPSPESLRQVLLGHFPNTSALSFSGREIHPSSVVLSLKPIGDGRVTEFEINSGHHIFVDDALRDLIGHISENDFQQPILSRVNPPMGSSKYKARVEATATADFISSLKAKLASLPKQ